MSATIAAMPSHASVSTDDNRLRARLDELRAEIDKGERHLRALDEERAAVRDALLRLSGAAQAIDELLRERDGAPLT